MTNFRTDALSAAIIDRSMGDRPGGVSDFVEALAREAEKERGNAPFHFSTGGNVWAHPITGTNHMNLQLDDPRRTDGHPLRGPRLCGTLSSRGTGPVDRALDVAWIRIGGTGWLTATVDFDEPRLLLLLGQDLPATAALALSGEPLSRLLDLRLFGNLDPLVERIDPWPAEHVNATMGKQVMQKDSRPALGVTLAAAGDTVLSTAPDQAVAA